MPSSSAPYPRHGGPYVVVVLGCGPEPELRVRVAAAHRERPHGHGGAARGALLAHVEVAVSGALKGGVTHPGSPTWHVAHPAMWPNTRPSGVTVSGVSSV